MSPLSTVIHTACLEIVYGFLHTTFGRESLNCNCIEFKFSSKSTTTYSSQSMAKHMEMHKLDFLFLASFFSSNFFVFFIRMTTTTTMTTVLTMLACNSRYKAVKLKWQKHYHSIAHKHTFTTLQNTILVRSQFSWMLSDNSMLNLHVSPFTYRLFACFQNATCFECEMEVYS